MFELFDCLLSSIPRSCCSKSLVPKSGTSGGFIDRINNQPTANTPKATNGFTLLKNLPILTTLDTAFATPTTAFTTPPITNYPLLSAS